MENISFPSDENIIIPNKAWFRVVLVPNIHYCNKNAYAIVEW